MNTFIFFVTLVVTVAAVVIVVKMVTRLFFLVAKHSQSFVLFVKNKWNAHLLQKESKTKAKAKAKAMATRKAQAKVKEAAQYAEDLAKYKEIAEAKAKSLSEAANALHPVFTENRDWSEYDSPAFIRKGKAFVF